MSTLPVSAEPLEAPARSPRSARPPAPPHRTRTRGRTRPRAVVLRACRPRQWPKNVVVVIAPAAAGALDRPGVTGAVVAAVVAFCLMSSATYLINDVRDRHEDRRHPRKRRRPVAAGELSPERALRLAAFLAGASLCLALVVRPALALVILAYAALTLMYTLWWRDVVVADVVAVAAGFVLRAVAGGAAAAVALSPSFLVVTCACALFLIAGKRYAEAAGPAARAAARPTLRRYSRRTLRLLVGASALAGCAAYARWSFARPELGPWLALSLIPFSLWLIRYRTCLELGAGEAPEELVLRDPLLLTACLVWALLFTVGIYGTP